jgi:hypothetical protein
MSKVVNPLARAKITVQSFPQSLARQIRARYSLAANARLEASYWSYTEITWSLIVRTIEVIADSCDDQREMAFGKFCLSENYS